MNAIPSPAEPRRPRRERRPWHAARLAGICLGLCLATATVAAERPGFSLVDHTGKAVTAADLGGEFLVVYFGYTHCPDICPLGLSRITAALGRLGASAERLRPVFITIDPERDTAERLAGYVGAFHPRMVGLTGTREQVAAAARAFDVRYVVGKFGEEYVVDHTAAIFVLGPRGRLLETLRHDASAADLAAAFRAAVGEGQD